MKTKNAKKEVPPQGAVMLNTGEREYQPRTGDERVNKISDGVYAIWPSNKHSKAVPEHGPIAGVCRESGAEFLYYTHVLPDKDGVFVPARYDLHPETFAARIDDRQARLAKLPAALLDIIQNGRSR